LNSSPDEIRDFMIDLSFEARALEKEVTDICWYMRGSISWDQAWRLTASHRETITKKIKSNIETTEKTGLPII